MQSCSRVASRELTTSHLLHPASTSKLDEKQTHKTNYIMYTYMMTIRVLGKYKDLIGESGKNFLLQQRMEMAYGNCAIIKVYTYTCTCCHLYTATQNAMYMYIVHVREIKKEGKKKQGRSNKNKQSNTAHPRQSLFPRKMSCRRWDSNP